MKKLLALLLVFAMCFGILAACTPKEPSGTEPPATTTAPPAPAEDPDLASAVAYVKNIYKTVSEKTPQDFTRVGNVPMGEKNYEVVWSVDVAEDLIKIVKNEDGSVTIDVNEEADKDTPYVLTATLTGTDGRTETLSWNHLLPASLGGNMSAIVDAGYALADGEKLDGVYTLTGKIINVDTAWSSEYKNITVTIAVEGKEDKPIMCYRLTGDDLDAVKKLAYGDTITVSGTLKNYKGTIEFDQGCMLLEVVKGDGKGPEAPETYEEIVADAYALAEGKSLPYTATLTGKVIRIDYGYSEKYGDISLTFECRGKQFYCYRLTGPEEWLKQVGKGDWITVKGKIKNYYGTVEFDAGCKMIAYTDWVKAEDVGEANQVSSIAVGDVIVMANGTTFMGKNASGSRLAGVEAEIVDNTVVVNDDMLQLTVSYNGTYYVFTNPSGKYLTTGSTGGSLTLEKELTNYAKWKVESAGDGVFYITSAFAKYAGKLQQMEYYSGFTTYSPGTSDIYKIAFYKLGEGEAVELPPETEVPEEPAEATELTILEAIELGNSFEKNQYSEELYKVTGVVESIANTTYGNLYIQDEDGNKLYIYGLYNEAGDRFDAMDPQPAVGDTITVEGVIGKYNDPQMKNATMTELVPGAGETPDTPVVPEEPAEPATLTIPEAIALGNTFEKNQYSEEKYEVTGVIESITNTTYGNLYIQDAEGNKLLIYGLYNEDGSVRYDAMDPKPAVGDTITVVGIMGKYNEPQMKNGWMTEHVPAPEELTITEAIELGNTFEKNKYSEEKYEVTGVIESITNTTYGNLYIQDAEGNKLLIYGLYSADGSVRYDAMDPQPAVGDTITVVGIMGKYNEPQMKNGWMTKLVPGEGDSSEEPAEPTTLTITEAIALGNTFEKNQYSEEKYEVTGVIESITNTTYGNLYIQDAEGNKLLIYGLYNEDGSVRYDAMDPQPAVGDTITVEGVMGKYNEPQMKNGWMTKLVPGETGSEGGSTEEETPDALPSKLTYEFSAVEMTPVGDFSTLSAEDALAAFLESEDNNNLKSVEATRIYAGNNNTSGAFPSQGGMLKTGSSSKAGQLVLTYSDAAKVTKVEIKCYDWYKNNSTPNTVAVNSSSAQNAPTNVDAEGNPVVEVLTFELDGTSNVVTIDATKRVFIFEIVVYFAD